jgi:integrase/recombinase XerD
MQQLREHLVAKGLADRSITEYEKWIRRAERWCWTTRRALDTLTAVDLREWSETLPDSWASRKMARAAMAHYYESIGRTDEIHLAIIVPRKPKMRSKALSPEEAAKLHAGALLVGGKKGLATLCGLYLAARRSEIAGLRWDGWSGGTFSFRRDKNHDVHQVPVHPALAEVLRGAKREAWSEYLFPGHGRPHVKPNTIWMWVTEVGRVAGVPVTTHQLRHTALTTALEGTKNLRAVMDLAGHHDPTVTAGYTRTSERELREVIAALDAYGTQPEAGAP